MSRIGKLTIKLPQKVSVQIENNHISVKGPFGELSRLIPQEIDVKVNDNLIYVTKLNDTRLSKQKHGLVRSLLNNMVIGVSKKFEIQLQMVGVGYRAQVQGQKLTLNVGYSHPVNFDIPEQIEVSVENNTNIFIKGIDKEKIGLLAAKIRAVRPPEPYKGKGIKYLDEIIIRKAGKSGK
jgi:large subunit ribosomal protein L6